MSPVAFPIAVHIAQRASKITVVANCCCCRHLLPSLLLRSRSLALQFTVPNERESHCKSSLLPSLAHRRFVSIHARSPSLTSPLARSSSLCPDVVLFILGLVVLVGFNFVVVDFWGLSDVDLGVYA